jgi:polyferredoxin
MFFGYFKNRYWCSTICPRGSFFDVILKRFSNKSKIPSIFKNNLFQVLVLIILMGMFILNVKKAFNFWGSTDFLDKLGMVGVMMCLVTTIIGIILGYFIHHRSWCVFCPMGTVQKSLFKLNKKVKRIKSVLK